MIRLHHCHQTRSMRVLWLLYELEIDFELVVRPFDSSLRQPDYLSLSPAGRVPAIEIDDLVMFESGAILEYLCELFTEKGLGRSAGDPERAEWLIWIHFSETLGQHCANLNQQHNVIYPVEARSPLIMKLEAKRAEKCLAAIDNKLTDGRDYLLKSGFSAADVAVGQSVFMAKHFVDIAEFPSLSGWFQRISSRQAYQDSVKGEDNDVLFGQDFYPVPVPD